MEKKHFLSISVLLFLVSMTLPISFQVSNAQLEEVPVPRSETLVIDYFVTVFTVFDSFNNYIPEGVQWGSGWHQICNEWDWYINHATGEVIPWRITGWEYTDDFATLILNVRRGVKWNDGEPYTARDIAFSYNMFIEYADQLGTQGVREQIDSAEVLDDYRVAIHLKTPNPRAHYMFLMWSGPNVVAEHVWKDKDPTTFKNYPPVETGPYKLYKVIPELETFIWERDEDYWGREFGYFPKPKYIVCRKMPAADIELENFVSGMVDVPPAHGFGWDLIEPAMARTPNATYAVFMDPCNLGIAVINCARYPLNVTEFRQALSYAIDREKVAKLYPRAPNGSIAAYMPFSAWKAFDKYRFPSIVEKYSYKYDPQEAASILDNLGFRDIDGDGMRELPNGTDFSLAITSYPPPSHDYIVSQEAETDWKAIGISVSISTQVDPTLFELLQYGRYDVWAGGLCLGGWPTTDLYPGLEPYHSKYYVPAGERATGGWMSSAFSRYRNTELDGFVDELTLTSPEDPGSMQLYEKALESILKDPPFIPMFETMFTQAFSTTYWRNWPSYDNPRGIWMTPFAWWPSFIFVLFGIEPVEAPVTVVTTTVRETVTTTTTVPAQTITQTISVPTMDVTTVAGAGIAALVVGVVVGWLVGSRKS